MNAAHETTAPEGLAAPSPEAGPVAPRPHRRGGARRVAVTVLVAAAVLGVLAYLAWRRYFYDRNPYVAPLTLSSLLAVAPCRQTVRSAGRSQRHRHLRLVNVMLLVAVGAALLPDRPAAAADVRAGAACKRHSIGETVTARDGTSLMCVMQNGAPAYRACPAQATTPTALEGAWSTTSCSIAGYRVFELFAGKPGKNPAVGRTDKVEATMTVVKSGKGWVARDAKVTVDMTSLASQEAKRDATLARRGLETGRFPTATFASSGDIALPSGAGSGNEVSVVAAGKLTLHGVTRDVELPIRARFRNGQIRLLLNAPVVLAHFQIDPPSVAGFVTVDGTGTIEALLVMSRL